MTSPLVSLLPSSSWVLCWVGSMCNFFRSGILDRFQSCSRWLSGGFFFQVNTTTVYQNHPFCKGQLLQFDNSNVLFFAEFLLNLCKFLFHDFMNFSIGSSSRSTLNDVVSLYPKGKAVWSSTNVLNRPYNPSETLLEIKQQEI